MEVIPPIDLIDGKAVRLLKGRYEDVTVYHDDPPVLAAGWAGHVKRLHVVDLEGARAGTAVEGDLVTRLGKAVCSGVPVGGGGRSVGAGAGYFSPGVEGAVTGATGPCHTAP